MNEPLLMTPLSTMKASAMNDILTFLEITDYKSTIKEDAIQWVKSVFHAFFRIKNESEFEPRPPKTIRFSDETTTLTLMKLVSLLTYDFDFDDIGLYYLNDVGEALGADSKMIRRIIEANMNSLRAVFVELTMEKLDQKQRNWCALIILKMIFADGCVHPSEQVYFTVIEQLIKDSGKTLADLKQAAESIAKIPSLEIRADMTYLLLKHIVAIAMFDGEYVGKEAEFIKQAAKALQIEEKQVESIIQPVASAYMVIQSLFP